VSNSCNDLFSDLQDGEVVRLCAKEEWVSIGGSEKTWLARKDSLVKKISEELGISFDEWTKNNFRILIKVIRPNPQRQAPYGFVRMMFEKGRGQWKELDCNWALVETRSYTNFGNPSMCRFLIKCDEELLMRNRENIIIRARRM